MPLLSADAKGSIYTHLTFSVRKSGQQVRYQRKQKDVITAPRTAQREKFNQGLLLWSSLPDNEKHYWHMLSKDEVVVI
jgi:hypothetical protein